MQPSHVLTPVGKPTGKINLDLPCRRFGDRFMPPAAVRPPHIAILIAVTAVGPLALNIFIPSIPGLVRVFATDYGTAQLALTLYLVGIALGQLVYGPLSDRFGRRPVLLGGLSIFVAASL